MTVEITDFVTTIEKTKNVPDTERMLLPITLLLLHISCTNRPVLTQSSIHRTMHNRMNSRNSQTNQLLNCFANDGFRDTESINQSSKELNTFPIPIAAPLMLRQLQLMLRLMLLRHALALMLRLRL